ncbi:hypothetical protein BIW11_11958 [Tropilaelaps mercedesae]|uniref:Uncharacterized protein n=1 Tax=Tropilaelaps mercedesae TaxID=418985 RepID=A0A1V9X952_9ACAR|nr:hypothetical protein BIW11_11958 [Tropilaelaps mercedesae]
MESTSIGSDSTTYPLHGTQFDAGSASGGSSASLDKQATVGLPTVGRPTVGSTTSRSPDRLPVWCVQLWALYKKDFIIRKWRRNYLIAVLEILVFYLPLCE